MTFPRVVYVNNGLSLYIAQADGLPVIKKLITWVL